MCIAKNSCAAIAINFFNKKKNCCFTEVQLRALWPTLKPLIYYIIKSICQKMTPSKTIEENADVSDEGFL